MIGTNIWSRETPLKKLNTPARKVLHKQQSAQLLHKLQGSGTGLMGPVDARKQASANASANL